MTSAMLRPVMTDAGQQALPSVQERAQRAGQQAGIDTVSIEKLPFDLSALEDDGIVPDRYRVPIVRPAAQAHAADVGCA
jgi:hypothetical protein